MEPLPIKSRDDDDYMEYFGYVFESALWCSFRCLLTLYILSVLCRRYCRSYRPLFQGLREIGLRDQYCRYEIIVGDPTYVILSDPLVALVMVTDTMLAPPYIAWSIVRVCQFHDLSAFFLGCFYSSRYVWCGYLAMRCTSYMARWRRWEAKFSPIDPGMLAIAALLYGDPVMSLIGNTSMLLVFHDTWDIFLPAQLKGNNIDGAGAKL
ncbi:hypothetical protein AC1031_015009 [Aphanomyces cochlioides]|nr:hypothetical protein AC1031_015009 [Aphanomyces cochlioides]